MNNPEPKFGQAIQDDEGWTQTITSKTPFPLDWLLCDLFCVIIVPSQWWTCLVLAVWLSCYWIYQNMGGRHLCTITFRKVKP